MSTKKLETIEDMYRVFEYAIMLDSDWESWFDNEWEKTFFADMCKKVSKPDFRVSTKQGEKMIKIAYAKRGLLAKHKLATDTQIDIILENKKFRTTPYTSKTFKSEVRYAGDDCLLFRFMRNETITEQLKKSYIMLGITKSERTNYCFMKESLLNIDNNYFFKIMVTQKNVNHILEIIDKFDFEFDDDVLKFLERIEKSIKNPTTAIINNENGKIILNTNNKTLIDYWLRNHLDIEQLD